MAITDGLYELRTLLNTSMALDVAGGSATKGANVQLYSANGTNAQKFYLVDEGDGYSLQNAQSQMFVDVAGGAAANRTNVQQYTDNDTRAQRWALTETGTVTIDGVACSVVTLRSNVSSSISLMMDVTSAMTTDKTNIWIYTSNGSDAQKWALLPTELLDRTLAAPSGMGWVDAVYQEDVQETRFEASTLYPAWDFPTSWAPGSAAFSYRYRSRDVGDAAGEWSAWSAWANASIATRGARAWLTSGLPASVTQKALEYQLQVRSLATVDGKQVHSLSTTALLRAAAKPTAHFTSAEIAYTGLNLAFTSDYTDGTNTVVVESIQAGGRELLAHPVTISGLGAASTASIDSADLLAPIAGGDSLSISYRFGTDSYSGTVEASAALDATYAAGHSLDMTSTYVEDDGRMLRVTVPEVGTEQVWTVTESGMWPAYDQGDGTWLAFYPFGQDFELYVTGINASGTAWGDYSVEVSASTMPKGCHAWSWQGGTFLLEVLDGFLTTERDISARGDAVSLNSRDWQTIQYSNTLEGGFDAKGVIDVPVSESTKAQMMALIRAHHAIYRAPTGEVARVGIDGINYSSFKLRTEVSVQMTQESI